MKSKIFVLASFLVLFFGVAASGEEQILTVDEIVRKANHMALYQGMDCKGKVNITITDKHGRIRLREFNILRKNVDNRDGNQKYFAYFLDPADVRKMVFMVHKHSNSEEEDDRWLYMPSLDLIKRIASGDKRTSFVGSDFLYEDISGRNVNEDIHQLIKTTDDYYVVKNVPKKPDSAEFEYYIAYIDKEYFLPGKLEYFKEDGRLYREIVSHKVEMVESEKNGKSITYPTITETVARDIESENSSVMTYSKVQYNTGVEDDIFTERYLRRPPRIVLR